MGNTASSEKLEAAAKEQMEFLIKSANSKLAEYKSELNAMFTDPAAVEKVMVPGVRAIRWQQEVRVDVKKDNEHGGLGDIISGFFDIGEAATSGDTTTQKHDVAAGLKKVVLGSIQSILGSVEVGESEQTCFFVYVEHNTVIRIDVKIWKYNFSATGVMASAENVFAYIFCTSVVDSAKLHVDELTYLLSQYAGDKDVNEYVDVLLKTWETVAKMRAALKQLETSPITQTTISKGHID